MKTQNATCYTILLPGPLPPPYHGVAVNTRALLVGLGTDDRFKLVHVDTADRRGLSNLGRWDFENTYLALKHGSEFLVKMIRHRPDIVYVQISQNTPAFLRDCLFMLPAVCARRKLIIHLHGSEFRTFYDSSSVAVQWLIRHTLKHTHRVIVLGEGLRSIFDGLISEDRIVAIPNGLDPELFERSRPVKRDNGFQILYLGNLIRRKGYRVVLRAAALLVGRCPSTVFTFLGGFATEDESEWAEQFVEEHCLHDVVSFLGTVTGDRKAEILMGGDVFVFPPIEPEGHPMVLLEAMAAGLPIITTDQGAITETVLDNVNGFIVPSGDPQAIAEKLLLLLRDRKSRARMQRASCERFLSHFTVDRWIDDMKEVFEAVAHERTR